MVEEARRREVPIPGLFGVFFYRSAKPRTLKRLAEFLPVPTEGLTADFAGGATAEEVCAKTIRGARECPAVAHSLVSSQIRYPLGISGA